MTVKTAAKMPRYFPTYDFWNLELSQSGHNRRGFTKLTKVEFAAQLAHKFRRELKRQK